MKVDLAAARLARVERISTITDVHSANRLYQWSDLSRLDQSDVSREQAKRRAREANNARASSDCIGLANRLGAAAFGRGKGVARHRQDRDETLLGVSSDKEAGILESDQNHLWVRQEVGRWSECRLRRQRNATIGRTYLSAEGPEHQQSRDDRSEYE